MNALDRRSSRARRQSCASTVCAATVRSFVAPCSRASSRRLPPQRTRVTAAASPGAAAMQLAASGRSVMAAAWAIASVARSLPGATTAAGREPRDQLRRSRAPTPAARTRRGRRARRRAPSRLRAPRARPRRRPGPISDRLERLPGRLGVAARERRGLAREVVEPRRRRARRGRGRRASQDPDPVEQLDHGRCGVGAATQHLGLGALVDRARRGAPSRRPGHPAPASGRRAASSSPAGGPGTDG